MSRINRCHKCKAEVRPAYNEHGEYLEISLWPEGEGSHVQFTAFGGTTRDEAVYLAVHKDSPLGQVLRSKRLRMGLATVHRCEGV